MYIYCFFVAASIFQMCLLQCLFFKCVYVCVCASTVFFACMLIFERESVCICVCVDCLFCSLVKVQVCVYVCVYVPCGLSLLTFSVTGHWTRLFWYISVILVQLQTKWSFCIFEEEFHYKNNNNKTEVWQWCGEKRKVVCLMFCTCHGPVCSICCLCVCRVQATRFIQLTVFLMILGAVIAAR